METTNNQSEEKNHLTQVRQPVANIIEGASDTNQIAAMQANAAQAREETKSVGAANILEVNNGNNIQSDNGTDDLENLENPATRGI